MGHATLGGRVAAGALALLTCLTFFPGSSFAGRDKRPPSTPSNLSVAGVTATGFTVSWTASTDRVGVAGYRVWLNSTAIGTTSATSYSFSGLACGTISSRRMPRVEAPLHPPPAGSRSRASRATVTTRTSTSYAWRATDGSGSTSRPVTGRPRTTTRRSTSTCRTRAGEPRTAGSSSATRSRWRGRTTGRSTASATSVS